MTGLLDWLYSLMPPNLPASEHAAGRSHSASMEPPEPQPLHQVRTTCLGCDITPDDGVLHKGPDKQKNLCLKCHKFWRLHGILRSKQVANGALKPEYAGAWLHQHQHQHKHKHVDEASDVSGDSRQLRKLPAQPERYSPDGTVPSHGSGEKSSRHHHHHHADMVSPGLSRGQGHGSLSDEESAATSASPWLSSQQRHSHPPCARKTSPLKSPSRTERTLSPLRSHQHKLEPSSAMGNPHGHEGRAAASGGGDGGEGRGERKATYGDNGERAYHPSRDEGSHASGMKRLLTDTPEDSVVDAADSDNSAAGGPNKAKKARVSGTSKLLRLLRVDMVEDLTPSTTREDRRRRAQRQALQPDAVSEERQKRGIRENTRSGTPGLEGTDSVLSGKAESEPPQSGGAHMENVVRPNSSRPNSGIELAVPMAHSQALVPVAEGDGRAHGDNTEPPAPDAFAALGIGPYCDLRGCLGATHPLAKPSLDYLYVLERQRKEYRERKRAQAEKNEEDKESVVAV